MNGIKKYNNYIYTIVVCVCVCLCLYILSSQVAQWVQNPPAMQETQETWLDSTPGWKRCPQGGHGNPLQYSCMEHPMDRGDWQTTGSQRVDTTEETEHVLLHTYIYTVVMCWFPMSTSCLPN